MNPSDVYFYEWDYNFMVENSPAGEVINCILNDIKKVDTWRFPWAADGENATYRDQE